LDNAKIGLDIMGRLQLGRLSFRLHTGGMEFKGGLPTANLPEQIRGESLFRYAGWRIGGDFDVFQRGLTRIGADIDYDLFQPYFYESIRTPGGKAIYGSQSCTIGLHGIIHPGFNLMGVTAIVESRARWSVSGSDLTQWEFGLGVKSSDTIMGSISFRGGYRFTDLHFSDYQAFNNIQSRAHFQVEMPGWFGEMAYYY
jgi:hypothetical protein